VNALLASLLLLAVEGQETPDEAFKKIEAAIEAAKTVKVEFTIDGAAKDASPGKGSLSIEENGRVKLSVELRSKEKRTLVLDVTCDGQKIVSSFDQSRVDIPFDPKLSRSNFNMYLSRLGIFSGSLFQHGFSSGAARARDPILMDLKQLFQVQNVRASGDGKNGTKILTYDLKAAFEPMPLDQAKIWYDPKTYKIVRREYRLKNKNMSEVVYEDYDDLRFGDEKPVAAREKPAPAPPVSDAEMDNLFFKAKLDVAGIHLKAGKKDKAAEILEELLKTYPRHPQIGEAQRLLEEAKKK